MALQIIAWMASGLYFSLVPISEIRGEHLTRQTDRPAAEQLGALASPGVLGTLLDSHIGEGWSLTGLNPVTVDGKVMWRVEGERSGNAFARLITADGSRVMPELSAEGVKSRARGLLLTPSELVDIELVDHIAVDSEIRGRGLPVWRVDFGGQEPVSLYLHPWTGDLLARRTNRWRIFDFLWMLHIMDFDTRDDFNHPLLQVAAAMGLLVALSGVVFWAMTSRLFRRRKKAPGQLLR